MEHMCHLLEQADTERVTYGQITKTLVMCVRLFTLVTHTKKTKLANSENLLASYNICKHCSTEQKYATNEDKKVTFWCKPEIKKHT